MNNLTGTRIGAVFYPRVVRGGYPVAHSFISLGTFCSEAVGEYDTMIDGFYNQEFVNPYEDFIRGEGTYPATAISKLSENIKQAIDTGDPIERRRIVIVLTNGNNDGELNELIQAVHNLTEIGPSVAIIAAGNNNAYRSEPFLTQRFREELTFIANGNTNNVVISSDPISLAVLLIEKLVEIQVIGESEGEHHYFNLTQCFQ